ncbi:ATP-binding cassette domain-containing protein [Cellulomonas aerilata]|uniref:ABC transporter ATP-binding protein n=1 Tax=Cellulomonas aerilata TaxID=515326 RepID=A0A512D9T3_9CELL|nr:ATP-binding cassette domain-containing protein [Cellulomonas aerilata]GEO33248.1 ABC transporter ATP-binding protein [Cellulomonas aerilata]
MIEIRDLTKRYGSTTAVDHLTVTIAPGVVTGFLGPNGAGKSTTMRLVLGLDRPDSGQALVGGRPYARHEEPLRQVGALLDARAVHPGRRAVDHLRTLAASNGIGPARVREVLELVGLADVARSRAGTFSLGMGQRLGIAAALLGDPPVVMLDEPVNGLDPDGIIWVRRLLRSLADEGRTVLVSSHLMSEMALIADHLVILGRGRLLADVSLADMIASTSGHVRVAATQPDALHSLLRPHATLVTPDGDALAVTGMGTEQVARLAHDAGLLLVELTPVHASLEEAYLRLTQHDVEYRAAVPDPTDLRSAAA